MRDLVERIYEGFYGNVVKFDNTMERVRYYAIRRKGYDEAWEIEYKGTDSSLSNIDWNAVDADIKNYEIQEAGFKYRIGISKDAAAYGIDTVSDLIVAIDSKPGSKLDSFTASPIKNYFNAAKKTPKELKTYTAGAIKKIIAKLCEDPSNARIIRGMYSEPQLAENNIKMAFVMACLKANNIVSKDFKYVDLDKENIKEAEIGLYVEAAITAMSLNAYTLPLSASQLSAKTSEERAKYDDTLNRIDSLKEDIILLRDNAYPLNQMVIKTISDIESRCRVIAKLANKFKK